MNTIHALVIGDPHFKSNNIVTLDKFTASVYKHLDDVDIDYKFIVVLGDLLDTFERVHMMPLCKAVSFITKLSEYAHTFLLIGNHDRQNNSEYLSKIHAFTALENTKHITIVDQTKLVETPFYNFLFVPYVFPGRFDEAITTLIKDGKSVDDFLEQKKVVTVFAHQEIRGCKMGHITSSEGDVWPENRPMLISGHIHDEQLVAENVYYVGTPFQQDFDEDFTNKGIARVRWVTNENDEIIVSRVKIPLDIPRKITLKYPLSCIIKQPDITKLQPLLDIAKYPNDIIRVELDGTTAEYKSFINSEQHVHLQKKCKIKYVITDVALSMNAVEKITVSDKTFDEMIMEKISKLPEETRTEMTSIYKSVFVADGQQNL